MTLLLLGIFLAAVLFGAILWSGYRAYITSGRTQLANLLTTFLTILAMAMITYGLEAPGRTIGAMLAVSALAATFYEERWSRLLPFTLFTFGVFAAIGTPFT